MMLSQEDIEYIRQKNPEGWIPDVIIGRNERNLGMSVRTYIEDIKTLLN